MPIMKIENFSFTYASAPAPSLKGITLPIMKNKITSLIGPSGCGKSTLLRSMNRIHDLYPGNRYEGKIELLNLETNEFENILEIKKENDFINLRQKVGMIFQKPTPFPMSIFDNVAYGLKIMGIKSKSELEGRVEEALKGAALWNEVSDRLNKSAMGLSGGQQQRLCIARAVAVKPEVLLFDEPTSALDPISTGAIEELIVELKDEVSIAIVTHNMQQASRISDYTAFMYLGDLIEYDETETIFLNPKEKLSEIKDSVIEIAKGLCQANEIILDAMSECDEVKFKEAREYIRNIGDKTTAIDNNIVKTLALYSPEAKDLRLLVAYLKVTNELVRASSNTRSFIKGFTITCVELDKEIINEYAIPMQKATVEALKYLVEMIDNNDSDEVQELYSKVLISESKSDDLYDMIETSVLAKEELKADFKTTNKMLSSLRKSEKIADRALSIASLLLYASIGGEIH